jgi:hypothetical protein
MGFNKMLFEFSSAEKHKDQSKCAGFDVTVDQLVNRLCERRGFGKS